jgi:hypothetical protein
VPGFSSFKLFELIDLWTVLNRIWKIEEGLKKKKWFSREKDFFKEISRFFIAKMVNFKSLAQKFLKLFLLKLLLSLVFLVFYSLSHILTSIGSFLLFLALFFISLRLSLQLLLFPGSFTCWTKSHIQSYSKISVFTLRHQANEFCSIIENMKTNVKSHLCFNLLTSLDTLISTFKTIQRLDFRSSSQTKLQTILESLIKDLEKITLIYSNKTFNLIEWYEKMPCSIEKCKFNKETLSISENFLLLDKLLKENSEIFASLDYMRADLMTNFNASSFQVETSDKVSIDWYFSYSLFIPNGDSDLAVILCNPNAGLYEFASFQSDWIRLYLELGASLILWNYRGYGRSKGKVSLEKMKKDGENLVNYIRTSKLHIKVLGIHGESIGGCIAIHLAKECLLDFLIADRTFASLRSVALFRYGKLGYWLSCLARLEDFEYIGEYLSSNCPKVIICDPHDSVIHDFASLKAGVALRLLSHDAVSMTELNYLNPSLQLGFNHMISYAAASSCVEALNNLQDYLEFLKCGSDEVNQRHRYSPVSIDTEEVSNEHLAGVIDKMLTTLVQFEAGGTNLLEVVKSTEPNLALIIWLMVLDIWGSQSGDEQLSSHMKSVNSVRTCLQDIQVVHDEYEKSKNHVVQQVLKDVNTVFNVLIEVLAYMEERCGLSSNLEISIDRMITEFQGAGMLLPVSCGHNGSLSQVERYQLLKFLRGNLRKGEKHLT